MSRSRLFGAAFAALLAAGFAACHLNAADEPANPPPARGRGFGGGGTGAGALMLLRVDAVVKDLNLSDDQKAAVQKLADDSRKAMTDLRDSLKDATREERQAKMADATKEAEKKLDGILNEKQQARLKELRLQVRGPGALADKEVADALKLSDDQAKQIAALVESRRTAMRDAFQAGAGGDRTAAREKLTQLTKDTNDKMLAVLTTEQKEQFEKMQGTKLDLTEALRALRGQGRRGAGEAKSDSK